MSRETDLAWVAGMADGEGSIGVVRHFFEQYRRYYYRAIFNITNTDLVGVRRCLDVMGKGNVYVVKKNPPPGHRIAYIWGARGPNVAECLTLIMPYLVMKREQAELTIRASGLMVKRGQRQYNRRELEWIYEQTSAMHQGRDLTTIQQAEDPQAELDL